MNSAGELRRLLEESSIGPQDEAGARLLGYLALLEKWNVRINLTSSTEWRIIGPMFREGIWAASLYPAGTARHLDIGSGAGFPGLILKILAPAVELDMVEVREKKARFLEAAAGELGLRGVNVHALRLLDYLQRHEGKTWDLISWKALKLGGAEVRELRRHMRENTEIWMFHGKEEALEEPEAAGAWLEKVWSRKAPGMREWRLSAYRGR